MINHMTPGRIAAEYGGREITIFVEALLPGFGSPDFVIYENSIAGWDLPNEHAEFNTIDKQRVIEGLKQDLAEKQITFVIE